MAPPSIWSSHRPALAKPVATPRRETLVLLASTSILVSNLTCRALAGNQTGSSNGLATPSLLDRTLVVNRGQSRPKRRNQEGEEPASTQRNSNPRLLRRTTANTRLFAKRSNSSTTWMRGWVASTSMVPIGFSSHIFSLSRCRRRPGRQASSLCHATDHEPC
jgi:hypothetical protein